LGGLPRPPCQTAPLRGASNQAHHPVPRGEFADLGRNEGQDRGNAVIVGALAYVGPGVTVPTRLTPARSSIARRSEPTRRSARKPTSTTPTCPPARTSPPARSLSATNRSARSSGKAEVQVTEFLGNRDLGYEIPVTPSLVRPDFDGAVRFACSLLSSTSRWGTVSGRSRRFGPPP